MRVLPKICERMQLKIVLVQTSVKFIERFITKVIFTNHFVDPLAYLSAYTHSLFPLQKKAVEKDTASPNRMAAK